MNKTVNINSGGDVFGVDNQGTVIKNNHGTVINYHINFLSSEDVGQVKNFSTELNHEAGLPGNVVHPEPGKLKHIVDKLLEGVNEIKKATHHAHEFQAGNERFSHVELLLKKAILIKTETDQMYFDHLSKYQNKTNPAKNSSIADTSTLELNDIFADFDDKIHERKLQEVYGLLQQANELDPTNTEVLLHMAQVLEEWRPDDTHELRKILYRIQNLLRSPKDETEEFHLAQAVFLLGMSSDPVHFDLIKDARDRFKKIGRSEWVRHCDDLLKQPPNPEPHDNGQQMGFNPFGKWNIQVSDTYNSIMHLALYPNGQFDIVQQLGYGGGSFHGAGQWVFYNHSLHLQGFMNGHQAFMLGITIHNQQGNMFFGVGTDGYSYILHKIT